MKKVNESVTTSAQNGHNHKRVYRRGHSETQDMKYRHVQLKL